MEVLLGISNDTMRNINMLDVMSPRGRGGGTQPKVG